ncbi:PAS domain-containing sensor histidine kinase [bacterium]|nr:MAG: PAS domain-containing sensor histidine kinase [bacterium]
MKTVLNDPALVELAESNFQQSQTQIHARTDRMFAWVMATQYVLSVVFALLVSPRTWSGAAQQTHPHVWAALGLGGALASLPIFLALKYPGTLFTRTVIAISQALFSALLIHLTGGRIETHFHVFGSLAFLAMYRDWRMLIVASVVVASDHLVRGIWFPFSAYGVNTRAEWRFLEHAGWVFFEDAFLLVACATGVREMRSTASRQAQLELANDRIERSAAEITRQSAVLNSVLTGMSDGVIVVDGAGAFLHFNPAAGEILGPGSQDLPMSDWFTAFDTRQDESGACYPATDYPLAKAMRGVPVTGEEFMITRLGTAENAWVEASAQPLDLGTEAMGGVVVFRDITERRRMLEESLRARQEAERANRAKSEFLSRMSHELRTPMNAILGFGQLLKMDDLTADQDESLEQILKAGAHLLRLIDEVLDISGIEAGKLSISQETVDVPEVIREVVALVQPLAQSSRIVVRTMPTEEGTGFAVADQQRLLQVLLNLVSNAIKYNVEGGEVCIRTERAGTLLWILVEDTGIGIPEDKLALLFTPFERIGAQHTSVQGTGLGLALSKRLTEAMGGKLGVRSASGGTCFFIELHAAQCPLRVLTERGWKEDAPSPTVTREATILLIEDNPANGRLVEKILGSRPQYGLFLARTGQAGIDLACEHRPDLILLDLDLPDFSGSEVLRQLRRDSRFETTPVIVVSADATPSHIEGLMSLGVSAYLTKPIEVNSFLTHLDDQCQSPLEKRVA